MAWFLAPRSWSLPDCWPHSGSAQLMEEAGVADPPQGLPPRGPQLRGEKLGTLSALSGSDPCMFIERRGGFPPRKLKRPWPEQQQAWRQVGRRGPRSLGTVGLLSLRTPGGHPADQPGHGGRDIVTLSPVTDSGDEPEGAGGPHPMCPPPHMAGGGHCGAPRKQAGTEATEGAHGWAPGRAAGWWPPSGLCTQEQWAVLVGRRGPVPCPALFSLPLLGRR